jgi:urease accessory protein
MNDSFRPPDPDVAMHHRKVAASLGFVVAGARTILGPQHTPHPFHITRPFHLTGDPQGMATLYLQSSSGGLYGNDDLTLNVRAEAYSQVHLTTQAATVVHHARGGRTRQRIQIVAECGTLLEYLPDPVILFSGADLVAQVDATLADGAILMLGDAAITHDPEGSGQSFTAFQNTIRINNGRGVPILIERMKASGEDWRARTGGLPAYGVFFVAGAIDAEAVHEAIAGVLEPHSASSAVYAACAAFPERGVVIARFLCTDSVALSRIRDLAWSAARRAVTGLSPALRRK